MSEAVESGDREIFVWGTGKASSEFFYLEDCAGAIILATGKQDRSDVVNTGAELEVSIKDSVELITKPTGFEGEIVRDTAHPMASQEDVGILRRQRKDLDSEQKQIGKKNPRKQ